MKKIILALILVLFFGGQSYAVELDADSNGAVDTDKGGLNTTDGTVNIPRDKYLAVTPGAVGSGNERANLWKINTPSGGATPSPFSMYMGGGLFDGVHDPVLYFGYNADRAIGTDPSMRQVLESDYYHDGYHDFEMYWEYVSPSAGIVQRPIFYFREKGGTGNHGLVFNETNINFHQSAANQDIYLYFDASGGSQGTVLADNGNRGIGMWAGNSGTKAGEKFFADLWGGHTNIHATQAHGNTDYNSTSANTKAAINLLAGAGASDTSKLIAQVTANYVAFYKPVDLSGWSVADYERTKFVSTAGNFKIEADSGGTGSANIDIELAPKGTGSVKVASGGSANHAICWKADGKTLGYCSAVVAADGTCGTCN